MTIYDRTRNGRPVNPAKALYNFWHTVLVNATPEEYHRSANFRRGSIAFGNNGGHGPWSLSFAHDGDEPLDLKRPAIHFGGSTFALNRHGEFMLNYPHGWIQRDMIARNTFLRLGRVANQYVWTVDTSLAETCYTESQLLDWNNQIHYVSEHVMGTKAYGDRPWLKLEWSGELMDWTIAFSRRVPNPRIQGWRDASAFASFEALRRKRLQRAERHYLIETGAIPAPAPRRRLSEDEIEERKEAAALALAAHLNVGMAAKTTPMKRTTEEVGLWEEQPGFR